MRDQDPALLHALNELEVSAPPLTEEQQARLSDAVLARVAAEQHTTSAGAAAHPTQARAGKPRHRRRRLFTLAAAAAVCGLLSVSAAAVGPVLLQMLRGEVDFFSQAPAQSQVTDPADAPRGEHAATQASIEAYNAAVGQTAESSGVTITLDSISMDSAVMNAFFTVTGERAVSGVIDGDDFHPTWSQLWDNAPRFYDTTVNGQPVANYEVMEFYRQDADTLKLWCRYPLCAPPQGEEVSVTLREDFAMGVTGEWRFDVTLDGASVRAGGRTVPLGEVYETGGEPLTLSTLTFGPVGGVVGAKTNAAASGSISGLDTSLLYIVDDTGKELYLTQDNSGGFGSEGELVNYYSLTPPDPAATALIVTPVLCDWEQPYETVTLTTEELRSGAKLETSALGGYTVQDFQVEDGIITWRLIPYGWNPGLCPELLPEDEGIASYAQGEGGGLHSALSSRSYDPQTGVYTCRLDYYAATQAELEQIAAWSYLRSTGCTLDMAHAITLPLQPVQP